MHHLNAWQHGQTVQHTGAAAAALQAFSRLTRSVRCCRHKDTGVWELTSTIVASNLQLVMQEGDWSAEGCARQVRQGAGRAGRVPG